jgi:hypothetical protein
VEIHGLFEQFVGNPRDLLGTHRSLFLEEIGVAREVSELEMNVDTRLRTLSERDGDLVVARDTVTNRVDVSVKSIFRRYPGGFEIAGNYF